MASDDRRPAALAPESCAELIEEAPVGIFVFQDGRSVYANRWLRVFNGHPDGAADPPDAMSFVHPEDRPLVAEQMAVHLAGGEARPSCVVRLLRRDGTAREVELYAKRVGHGGRPAVQGTIIDISARVEAERSFHEYAARLEESNRYRQLFGDILSHDLTNPVWVAENYLRFAMDGEFPEAKRPFLEGIRGALAKARAILVDARTYLKLQDRVALTAEPVDLGALVRELADGQRQLREGRNQTLELSLAEDVWVNGGALVREIVANLLSNAVKYGPPGSAIAVVLAAGPSVRLEVRDRGPGVPEEDRERIFQRFERMEKGAISGVGLGLAIVHRAARLCGARVFVEDNPGGGSVFAVEFPAAPARS